MGERESTKSISVENPEGMKQLVVARRRREDNTKIDFS